MVKLQEGSDLVWQESGSEFEPCHLIQVGCMENLFSFLTRLHFTYESMVKNAARWIS